MHNACCLCNIRVTIKFANFSHVRDGGASFDELLTKIQRFDYEVKLE